MSRKRHSFIAFYPSDWDGGTTHMSPMQRLVYFDICKHCWDHAVECSAAKLPILFRDLPDWRDVVDQLVILGKVYRMENGDVGNVRAMIEGKRAAKLYTQKSRGGKNKAKKMRYGKQILSAKSPEGLHEESTKSQPENQNQNQNQNLQTSLPSLGSARNGKSKSVLGGMGNGAGTRKGLRAGAGVTIEDPDERIARFQKKLVGALGPDGWSIIAAATDDTHPDHRAALDACRQVAHELGKGWPQNWPTQIRYS